MNNSLQTEKNSSLAAMGLIEIPHNEKNPTLPSAMEKMVRTLAGSFTVPQAAASGGESASESEGIEVPTASAVAANEQGKMLDLIVASFGDYFERLGDGWHFHPQGKVDHSTIVCGPLDLVSISTDEQGGNYRATFRAKNLFGDELQIEVPADNWCSGVSALRAAGGQVFESPSSKATRVATLMQGLYAALGGTAGKPGSKIKKYVRIDRPGWIKKDFRYFSFNSSILSADGTDGGFLSAPEDDAPTFEAAGTLEAWKEKVAKPCAWSFRFRTALSAGLAAPMLRVLDNPAKCSPGIHFVAGTSTGKSTTLRLINSLFGEKNLPNWDMTKNGPEAVAYSHDCLPLCIDELGQADKNSDLQQAIYKFGNGTGRTRMTRERKREPLRTWDSTWFSSGELSANEQYKQTAGRFLKGGADARLATMPLAKNAKYEMLDALPPNYPDVGSFIKSLENGWKDNYGLAGPEFVQKLMADIAVRGIDRIRQEYWGKVEEYTKKIKAYCSSRGETFRPEESRVLRCFVMYGYTGELAIQYGVFPWKTGAAMNAAMVCFDAWFGRDDSTPNRMADLWESLAGMPNERLERWDVREQALVNDGTFSPAPQNKWGTALYCDGQRVAVILPKDGLEKPCDKFGLQLADVRKEGLRRHYLIANEGTRGTFKIQPGKKQTGERYNLPIGRYIVIAVPAIQRITNEQGQDVGDVIGAGPWDEKKAATIAQMILGKAPATALAGVADEH